MTTLPYYLGAPLWAHANWKGAFFRGDAKPAEFLQQYAQFFNAVEGNTTFYSVPSESMVARWLESTPASFRFSFKFPREITHYQQLRHCDEDVRAFMQRLEPLGERAEFMVQLPASFSPDVLPTLKRFLQSVPNDFQYAVEVRHSAFFTDKVQRERYNTLLASLGVDRVIFESRPVHAAPALDEATREAHERKPRLPVQLDTSSDAPMLRYIGHPQWEENARWLMPWVAQTARWLDEGKQPRIYLHTPSNDLVPALSKWFHQALQQRVAGLPDLPVFPCEVGTGQLPGFL